MRARASPFRPTAPPTRHAGSAAALAALAAYTGVPAAAYALDLDDEGGLITETIARRERLKDYDSVKKYGAERVADRDRQHTKPDGLRAGNYLIFPFAGASVVFDDNIFRSDANKESDLRSESTAGVKFTSQLPRHLLDLSLDGKIVNYLENTDQDYANVRGKVDGALHFDHAHTLSVGILSAIEHEERGEIFTPISAAEPVRVFHNRAGAAFTRDVGRLYGTVSGQYESWNYDDVRSLGGPMVDQDARDSHVWSAQLRAGYRISPGFDFVGKVRAVRQFNRGDGVVDRDAVGYEALAGLAFEANPLLRFRVLGGYGFRDFDQSGLDSVATSLLEGHVQWLATQRTTFYASLKREIVDSVGEGGTGRIETSLFGRMEYEILNNLVATTDIEFRDADFIGLDRHDQTWSARLGLDYYLNRNWLLTLGYQHERRQSNEDDFDMTRNRVTVGAKVRF